MLANESTVWTFVPFGFVGHIVGVWRTQVDAESWITLWEGSGTLTCYTLNESVMAANHRLSLCHPDAREDNRVSQLGPGAPVDREWYEDGRRLGRNGRYPCVCCGYLTMESPIGGSFWICPVCNWEDESIPGVNHLRYSDGWVTDFKAAANSGTLAEARLRYDRIGASDERCISSCRAPVPEELPRQLRPIRPLNYFIRD